MRHRASWPSGKIIARRPRRCSARPAALEATLPIAFGPPTIEQPAHELLDRFLLRRGRLAEARLEFDKALASAPGRWLAERGLQAVGRFVGAQLRARPIRGGNRPLASA